eukprot:248318-Chlamydomonas_euryale.AAC.4
MLAKSATTPWEPRLHAHVSTAGNMSEATPFTQTRRPCWVQQVKGLARGTPAGKCPCCSVA